MDVNAIFKGIGEAKIVERGNPLTATAERQPDGTTKHLPAQYELEVIKCELVHAREGYDAFVATFKVLSSTNPDVKVGDKGRTWFQKMVDDTGKSAVKSFALAVLGIPSQNEDEVKAASAGLPELMAKAVGKENVFGGNKVHARVDQIITVKKQQPFNRHTFSPASSG